MFYDFYSKVKQFKTARWFIVFLRIILGLAFIYPGLPKAMGHQFTILGTDNPIGYFFDSLYRTGIYWNFIGWCQIITGLLLITQRFAAIGAILYLAIITNIFVITISLNFKGTPYVTFMMFLAGVLLIAWDYDKFKRLLIK